MLLLARIDGKSPVEYLRAEVKKDLIRTFVTQQLLQQRIRLPAFLSEWKNELDRFSADDAG